MVAVVYTVLCLLFFAALAFRRALVKPAPAAGLLIALAAALGCSFLNPHFARQIGKADNAALWLTLLSIAFFLWVAFRQAVENDALAERGQPPADTELARQRVFVWPYLVYIEAIAAAFALALLFAWSMALDAPLEAPADPGHSLNPTKAPWYFLGLQELLVYFDPWIAGVLLPLMAVTGLLCLPYCDPNPKGSGYYTFAQRPLAISAYLFGFLMLWIALIFFGAALRGPNWSFFSPYEAWDLDRVTAATTIDLNQLVWRDSSNLHWLVREAPGLLLLAAYFTLVPWAVARIWRPFYAQLGRTRYGIVMLHLLVMLAVPIKMYLHWCFGLKYIVHIPEYALNI